MAKKVKQAVSSTPSLTDTADLKGDARNPRRIDVVASAGLRNSLDRFGDLSGIVMNQRTGTLVAGHQRMAQIRAKWGDRPIDLIDAAAGLHGIRIDERRYFTVRVVDWSPAFQRAASVAANSQLISGEFTDDVGQYLQEIAIDLAAEDERLMDDVLLSELMAPPPEPTELRPVDVQPPPKMTWVLIGIPTVRFGEINRTVEELATVPEIILETTANDG